MKIIGLSGTFAAGKDTLAEYLVAKKGYLHVSTSDLVREDTQRMYGTTDRPVLHKHANQLRKDFGAGVLVEMALTRYEESKAEYPNGVVISGIRSIGAAEQLKLAGGTLLFIDADQNLRYERAFARKRDVEATMSLDDFIASEQKELDKPRDNKSEQNLFGVRDLADHLLDNGGTEAELLQSFEEINL